MVEDLGRVPRHRRPIAPAPVAVGRARRWGPAGGLRVTASARWHRPHVGSRLSLSYLPAAPSLFRQILGRHSPSAGGGTYRPGLCTRQACAARPCRRRSRSRLGVDRGWEKRALVFLIEMGPCDGSGESGRTSTTCSSSDAMLSGFAESTTERPTRPFRRMSMALSCVSLVQMRTVVVLESDPDHPVYW